MTSRSLPHLSSGAHFKSRAPKSAPPETTPNAAAGMTVDDFKRWTGGGAHTATDATEANARRRLGWAQPRWLGDMLVPDQNSFGVMRLLMALAVLISHCVFLQTGMNTMEPLYRWTGYTLGQHGVQVFFILSGILVMQSLMTSESVRDYAIARSLRIFPALIVCILFTALVLGSWLTTLPVGEYLKDKGVAAYIIKTATLMTGSAPLPGLFEHSPGMAKGVVNSSLWTLKYEVLCYIILAAIGWLAIRTKAYREVAIAAIAAWLALILYKRASIELGSQKSMFDVLRYFMLYFGTGVIAYVFRRHLPIHGALLVPLGIAFAVAIGTRFAEISAALFLGYGALWLATFKFGALREFTNANDYSYGTYIYGLPVSQALIHLFESINLFSLIALTIGIVLVLSFLSWELIERPALALRKRFSPRQNDAETTLPTHDVATVALPDAQADGGFAAVLANAKAAADAAMTARTAQVTAAKAKADAAAAAFAAAASKASTVQPEPGVARPWRPQSKSQRLVVDREPERVAIVPEAPMPPASVEKDQLPPSRLAFALKKKAAPAAPANVEPVAPLPASEVRTEVSRPRPRPQWRSPLDIPVTNS